jgi:hypothetical protein
MQLDQVQSTVKALLDADPALGGSFPIFVEDNVTDFTEQIQQALEDKGACFEIGDTATTEADSSSFDGTTAIASAFFLIVHDNPHTFHAPAGMSLVTAVIKRLTTHKLLRFQVGERFQSEKGGLMSVLTFIATCVVEPDPS